MANVQQCLIESNTPCIGLFDQEIKGNLNPKELYKHITNARGKPNRLAIDIMSDIIYWYRPKKGSLNLKKFDGDVWQTSYEYFENKFFENREQIRRVLVKLEDMNLIKREFRTIFIRGRRMNNVLFIHLNVENLSKLLSNNVLSLPKFVESSPQNRGDHIKETKNSTKIENNRSMDLASKESKPGSNFLNLENNSIYLKGKGGKNLPNDFCDSNVQRFRRDQDLINTSGINSAEIKINCKQVPKTLCDYLPLNDNLHETLQIKSGRDFSQIAMNEILESVSKKVPNTSFNSTKGFISYASKVLENEMRQSERVNNKDFRIKSNLSEEEIKVRGREQFLEGIESSRDTSEHTRYKKNIISSFSEEKAYEILKSLNSSDRIGGKLVIKLSKIIEMSDQDKKKLISKALEIYDKYNELKHDDVIIQTSSKQNITADYILEKEKSTQTKLPNNIWGKVRGVLIEKFGRDIDKSWFEPLESREDHLQKTIELTASNLIIKEWIDREYKQSISCVLNKLGFSLLGVGCS